MDCFESLLFLLGMVPISLLHKKCDILSIKIRIESYFLFFFFEILFIHFLKKGEWKERGRETSMCGYLLHVPHWGPGPLPRHVPWLGIELATLWFTACTQSTELHQPGVESYFLKVLFIFREREGREKETSFGCLPHAPHQGPGLEPRHVPWLGIELETLWFTACTQSTELHQPGQGWFFFFSP